VLMGSSRVCCYLSLVTQEIQSAEGVRPRRDRLAAVVYPPTRDHVSHTIVVPARA